MLHLAACGLGVAVMSASMTARGAGHLATVLINNSTLHLAGQRNTAIPAVHAFLSGARAAASK